jgi:hypothetical protein
MNDTELDRCLDSWQVPAPPRELREKLRARFPGVERRDVRRPRRWLLATAVAFAALAVAMGQSGDSPAGSRIAQALAEFWQHITDAFETHRAMAMVKRILESQQQVWIDGAPAGPLQHRHANVMHLNVLRERPYLITFWPRALDGWTVTGRAHGNYLEFEAGPHHVVVMCDRPLPVSDSPVLVRH